MTVAIRAASQQSACQTVTVARRKLRISQCRALARPIPATNG
jgi:hypothetical protein